MGKGRHRPARLAAGALWCLTPGVVAAQQAQDAQRDDIVVTGKRLPGSVIGDVAPVAELDAAAMKALGVTNLSDVLRLLKPLTTSASGADPVFLLNGRRISGFSEIQSIPPEAMEKTEVLPESEAARFGFPSTVRVVNFITKKRFNAISVEETAGTTTDGGGGSASLILGSTRLYDGRRTSLTVNYDRQNALRGTQRALIPDTSSRFDAIGNIGPVGNGSIDPALDALAGRPVTIAAVPADPATQGTLAGYVGGVPRVTDLAPYQSIPSRTMLKVDGTQAVPIGRAVEASLNLTMEAQRGLGLSGLSSAILRIPAGNPAVPFTQDTLLYRYIAEAGPLLQRTQSLALHAATTVNGSLKRWQWTVTGSYDANRASAAVDQSIDLGAKQAAIDAGGDPFAALTPAQAASRIVARSRTQTGTFIGKATATGPLIALPAGDARITLNGDLSRSTSSGALVGGDTPISGLSRVVKGASANLELPIASASRGVLGAIGSLTANGTIGVSSVSDYGSLVSGYGGLTWSPVMPLQFTASINLTQTPPPIAVLTTPVVTVPNAPYFDFVTGTSALVTVITGGNTALAPERRRIATVGTSWKPFGKKEVRLNLDYTETRIEAQTSSFSSVTPALQAAFPDRFVRDANGRLTSVDLRPVNADREVERKVQATLSLWTQLGPEPKPPAAGAPPPPSPKPRPMLYAFGTVTTRIDDRLVLRTGLPELNLLDGDTLDGSGGRPRYETQGNLGGSYGPFNGGLFAMWQAPTRIASPIAASDLRFSAKTFLAFYSTIDAAQLAPHAGWAKKLTIQLNVQNLLNDRIAVRDRNGVVPYRYQPTFLDPYGRIVKLGVRKLF